MLRHDSLYSQTPRKAFACALIDIFFRLDIVHQKKQAHLQHINPINGQLNPPRSPPQTGCTQQSSAPENPPWVTGVSGTKRIPFLNGVFGGTDIMQPLRHRSCHPRARDCAHYADAFGSWFSREHLPVESHVCPPHDSTPPPGAFRGRACVRLVLLNFSDSVYFVPPPPPFPNFWASALCISLFLFFFRSSGWTLSLLSPGEDNTSHSVAQPAKVVSKESQPDIYGVGSDFPPPPTVRLCITMNAGVLLAFVGKTLSKRSGQPVGIVLIV